jgi:hypothetical protein
LEAEPIVTPCDDCLDEQVQAFTDEIAASGWSASVTRPSSGHVCVRIERHSQGTVNPTPQALEMCRRSFAEAVQSARKHIHTQA